MRIALSNYQKSRRLTEEDNPFDLSHWLYFYERCIGCVGVLKDWLLRAVSATLDEGDETLTLERVQEHALSISQCEQMALDAVEGEQKLNYTEGRRDHLWRLLQGEGSLASIPQLPRDDAETIQNLSSPAESLPSQRVSSSSPSTTKMRAGQQAPRRNAVGEDKHEETAAKCPFSRVVDLEASHINQTNVRSVECPECGSVRTVRIQRNGIHFPSHKPLQTHTTKDVSHWVKKGTVWALVEKNVK